MFNHYRIIHFIGIGGIGMSGIAEILSASGYQVTGSDVKDSQTIARLRECGIRVTIGHNEENIKDAHVVVMSSAIEKDNPEIQAAKKRTIPVIPRAEMLAELGRLKYSVLVAGSHGKTTTTSIVSTLLKDAGYDPTVVIGGKLLSTNSNVRQGQGEFFVAEADESDGSFLKLNPTIAVCTNVDREHMDYFGTMDELRGAFVEFLNKVPFYGHSVVCIDNDNVRGLLGKINRRYTTYGFSTDATYSARNINARFMETHFDLYKKDSFQDKITIPLSGRHNVLNTLAAICVGFSLGIDIGTMKRSLSAFTGIKRRLEFKGEAGGVKIYDDYGHHPTEIIMTLKGIKDSSKKRIVTVFQPHRYTRTRDLLKEFGKSFEYADKVYLMDIYGAGEQPIDGVSANKLSVELKANGVNVERLSDYDNNEFGKIKNDLNNGDILLTFGAGDVWKVGEKFLDYMLKESS